MGTGGRAGDWLRAPDVRIRMSRKPDRDRCIL
jgi:hypothetical protein